MSASPLMHIMFFIPAGLTTVRSIDLYICLYLVFFLNFTNNWEKSDSKPFNFTAHLQFVLSFY